MENSLLETEAFSISRDLKAPRALIYEVQTDAKHLANWLSPDGFKTTHAEMDFRVGGRYHYCNEGPGGVQVWGLQRFREIVPNERIVMIQSFSDKDGGLATLIRYSAQRARSWYADGLRLVPLLDRRSAASAPAGKPTRTASSGTAPRSAKASRWSGPRCGAGRRAGGP